MHIYPPFIVNILSIDVCCHPFGFSRRLQCVAREQIVCEHSGFGNNWAMGYSNGEKLRNQTLSLVRKHAEKLDRFESITLMHSIGGGTGSGLGSNIIQNLRDVYPRLYLLAVSIAPFSSGDMDGTPIQLYNAAFALQWLQTYVDGIILKHNSQVLQHTTMAHAATVKSTTSSSISLPSPRDSREKNNPPVSLKLMNEKIAQDVGGLLFPHACLPNPRPPSSSARTKGGVSSRQKAAALSPWDASSFISQLCPMPGTKFVDVHTAATNASPSNGGTGTDVWHELSRQATRFARASSNPFCTLVSEVSVRGCVPSEEKHPPPKHQDRGGSSSKNRTRSLQLMDASAPIQCKCCADGVKCTFSNIRLDLLKRHFRPVLHGVEWNPVPITFRCNPSFKTKVRVQARYPGTSSPYLNLFAKSPPSYLSLSLSKWHRPSTP